MFIIVLNPLALSSAERMLLNRRSALPEAPRPSAGGPCGFHLAGGCQKRGLRSNAIKPLPDCQV